MTKKVKLVSKTESLVKNEETGKNLTAEELIVYCARVSNPNNQQNIDTSEKLLKYCIKHGHWSIFEQADITFEVKTSRAIAAQIIRHKSLSIQEFCVGGDTEIIFNMPSGQCNKMKIEELYRKWHKGAKPIPSKNGKSEITIPLKNRLKNMNTRYLDNNNTIQTSNISNVFYNGKKPLYTVELEDGKSIRCTKEHKFLDENYNFVSLEDLIDLKIDSNFNVKDFVPVKIGVNGIPNYQSYRWLESAKKRSIKNKTGVQGIADECGVSYNTIRRWLKRHELQFSKKEVAEYTEIWNKGKKGYKIKPRTPEQHKKMSNQTPKGKDHHSWKGGGRSERKFITDYIYSRKKDIFDLYKSDKCQHCGSNKRIEMHHIEEVCRSPEKAYDIHNILPLCHSCHIKEHVELNKIPFIAQDLNKFDWSSVRPDSVKKAIADDIHPWKYRKNKPKKNHTKVPGFSKIKSIKFDKIDDCYDLEIKGDNHNYVANFIIVHNSQRYAKVQSVEPIELREQGQTNRQVGNKVFDPEITDLTDNHLLGPASNIIQEHINNTHNLYEKMIRAGVAKESARMIMPMATTTTMYLKNNVRNWLTYLNVRLHKDAQKEHREIAEEIKNIFINEFPVISRAFNNFEGAYENKFL